MKKRLSVVDFRSVANHVPEALGKFDESEDNILFQLPHVADVDASHAIHNALHSFANITLAKLKADLASRGQERRGHAGRVVRKASGGQARSQNGTEANQESKGQLRGAGH